MRKRTEPRLVVSWKCDTFTLCLLVNIELQQLQLTQFSKISYALTERQTTLDLRCEKTFVVLTGQLQSGLFKLLSLVMSKEGRQNMFIFLDN